jgi:hypothetical protein
MLDSYTSVPGRSGSFLPRVSKRCSTSIIIREMGIKITKYASHPFPEKIVVRM